MKFSRKMREIDAIQEKNHYYKSDLYKMQIAMPYTETINDLQQKIGTLENELIKLKSRFGHRCRRISPKISIKARAKAVGWSSENTSPFISNHQVVNMILYNSNIIKS